MHWHWLSSPEFRRIAPDSINSDTFPGNGLTVDASLLQELGAAGLTKRPTSCMLVMPKPLKGGEPDEDFDTTYEAVFEKVKSVQPAF